jgi:1-acyl-sn-glycerol-3-phosphate acyltransferase
VRTLRAIWRLLRAVVHVFHGLAIVLLTGFAQRDAAFREARIRWWAGKTLRVLGVRLQAEGQPHVGPVLLVANHVSWMDIIAIHAVCPQARFVSKADVGRWPVIGRLVDAAGTLYIERERKRDALRVVHQMAEALQRGDTVAVFPEGTTSDGTGLLPFHANLLQAVITSGAPVQPVALRFSDPQHAVSPAAAYIGDTSLVQSLWWIACADGLVARVRMLPAEGARHADRRALAERLRQQIGAALGLAPAASKAGGPEPAMRTPSAA